MKFPYLNLLIGVLLLVQGIYFIAHKQHIYNYVLLGFGTLLVYLGLSAIYNKKEEKRDS
ncbi:hypothetical protein BC781_1011497 [Sediminitomix flava]|uniref:Uncharacterized protein n=1 Tax=Sediminitomix flava TaxID=379075 RepID=A0A315ZJT1_SEDFL|nr:hypothetical protein BC781_1011497 [Sediminitomix flava]